MVKSEDLPFIQSEKIVNDRITQSSNYTETPSATPTQQKYIDFQKHN